MTSPRNGVNRRQRERERKNIVKGTGSNLFHDRVSVIFDPDETGSRTEAPGYIEKRALVPRTGTVRDGGEFYVAGNFMSGYTTAEKEKKREKERGTSMQRACAA